MWSAWPNCYYKCLRQLREHSIGMVVCMYLTTHLLGLHAVVSPLVAGNSVLVATLTYLQWRKVSVQLVSILKLAYPCTYTLLSSCRYVFMQAFLQKQKSKHLLRMLLTEVPPQIRRTITPALLVIELLPPLSEILAPSFRPVIPSWWRDVCVCQALLLSTGQYSALLEQGEAAVCRFGGDHDIIWTHIQTRKRARWTILLRS